VEDRHFYQEPLGLSVRGILRAAYMDLRGAPLQGGSTITQQLAKNLYLSTRDTLTRKVKEAVLAAELASRYSRPQILDMYLNDIYLGEHAYGIQAAAETYFGVPVTGLTLPQEALLAGLPQAPSAYDPLVHPQAALARRNVVLGLMAQQGYISAAAARAAQAAPLGLAPGSP
ncbi:MAG: transglycosylase domain-containing protein, partial [Candidatus Dormibacteria bacterium]